MRRRSWYTSVFLGALLTFPVLSAAAPDAETLRLENAALCAALPQHCIKGVYMETLPTPTPRPPHTTGPSTPPPPLPQETPALPRVADTMTRQQREIMYECAQAVLGGEGPLTIQQLAAIDTCTRLRLLAQPR